MADVTCLLHTRNRPEFVKRALKSYVEWLRQPLIVLDASDSGQHHELVRWLASQRLPFTANVIHHDPPTPLPRRFRDALTHIETRYICLMADDDFTLPPIDDVVAYLDDCPESVVAYGQTLRFRIAEGFVPYGDVVDVRFQRPNPPAHWLDAHDVEDRLIELGSAPWSTLGWYAVHRRLAFERIIDVAAGVDGSMLERMLNIAQPILGRVSMVDAVSLARQDDIAVDRGISRRHVIHSETDLAWVRNCATQLLVHHHGFPTERALSLVATACAREEHQTRVTRHRKNTLVNHLKKALPPLVPAIRYARRVRDALNGRDPLAPDTRFPSTPSLTDVHKEIALIRRACTPLSVMNGKTKSH